MLRLNFTPRNPLLDYSADGYDKIVHVYSSEELHFVSTYVLPTLQLFQPLGEAPPNLIVDAMTAYKEQAKTLSPPMSIMDEDVLTFRSEENSIIMAALMCMCGSSDSNRFAYAATVIREKMNLLRNRVLLKWQEKQLSMGIVEPFMECAIVDSEKVSPYVDLPARIRDRNIEVTDGYDLLCHLYSHDEFILISLYVSSLLNPSQPIADYPLNTLCDALKYSTAVISNGGPRKTAQFPKQEPDNFRLMEKQIVCNMLDNLIGKCDATSFKKEAASLRIAMQRLVRIHNPIPATAVAIIDDNNDLWEVERDLVDLAIPYTYTQYEQHADHWNNFYNAIRSNVYSKKYPLLFCWDACRHLLPLDIQHCDGIPNVAFDILKLRFIHDMAVDKVRLEKFRDESLLLHCIPLKLLRQCFDDVRNPNFQECLPVSYVAAKLLYGTYGTYPYRKKPTLVTICRHYLSLRRERGESVFREEVDLLPAQNKVKASSNDVLNVIYDIYKCTSHETVLRVPVDLQCAYCIQAYIHYSNHCIKFLSREDRRDHLIEYNKCHQCGIRNCRKKDNHEVGELRCRFCLPRKDMSDMEIRNMTYSEKLVCNHAAKVCDSDRRWRPCSPGIRGGDMYVYMANICCIIHATILWEEKEWKELEEIIVTSVTNNLNIPDGEKYWKLLPDPVREDCFRKKNQMNNN